MAAFPSNILWSSTNSGYGRDLGIRSIKMEDGRIHGETTISQADVIVDWRISHPALTDVERQQVEDFLAANPFDIQLTNPANGEVYDGQMASRDISVRWQQSSQRYRVSWEFTGEKT